MAHPVGEQQEQIGFFDRGIGYGLKKTGQGTMWTLGKYGEGLDWTNEQVKLRNTPLGSIAEATGLDKNKYVSGALDYSYKDARDDLSEGAGNLTEQALKRIGRSDETAEAWGKGVEVVGQILIPDAVDYIGGVGYVDNLARAGDKLIDSVEGLGKGLSKDLGKGLNKVIPNQNLALEAPGIGRVSMSQVDEFTPANTLAIKGSGGGGFPQPVRDADTLKLIDAHKLDKPDGFDSRKWDNWIAKFGSLKGTEAAMKKADESAAYLKKHGSLKGNNNIWTDKLTGESYLVNNKTSRAAKLKGKFNINFDSLKSIEITLANRKAGADLNMDAIKSIAKDLDWKPDKVKRYVEESHQAKKTLEALIRDLNKGGGGTFWSLGHRRAVKTQAHSADRMSNIELEPLIDLVDKFTGRTIKGNTGRGANDELADILSKITDNPADLQADMLRWSDNTLKNFMPRMRPIRNADDFFREIVKRDDFIAKVEALAKKEGISLEDAGNDVLRPLMDKVRASEPLYYPEIIQENLGRITNAQVAVSSNGFGNH